MQFCTKKKGNASTTVETLPLVSNNENGIIGLIEEMD